jgi:hypothetical protein
LRIDRTKMFHVNLFGTIDDLGKNTFAARGKIRSQDLEQAENCDRFRLFPCVLYIMSLWLWVSFKESTASMIATEPFRSGSCVVQFALRREDFFALALGLLDVERRVRLAKFFESPIGSFERIIEMTSLVVLVE